MMRHGVDFVRDFDAGKDAYLLADGKPERAPVTAEAWVKVPADCQKLGMIVSNQNLVDPYYFTMLYKSSRTDEPAFSFYVNKDGHPGLFCYNGVMGSGHNGGVGSFDYVVDTVDLRTDEWTHIAFVRDIAGGTIRFYLNGKRVAETAAVTAEYLLEQPLGLGGDTIVSNAAHFRGALSGVRLWSVARTDEEIAAGYAGDVAPDAAGLTAYWRLDEDGKTADTFADVTGRHPARKHPFWQPAEGWHWPRENDGMILCIPDSQVMTRDCPEKLEHMLSYIADHRAAYDLRFIIHLGDQTNGNEYGHRKAGVWEEEWVRAEKAMQPIIDARIPFSLAAGNHDYDETVKYRDTMLMNAHFPVSIQKSFDCFGGSYDDSNDNTWFLLTVGETKYLILSLEFGPRNAVLDWANEVVAAHPDRLVIVASHDIVSPSGKFSHHPMLSAASGYQSYLGADVNDGIDIWEKLLKRHENIVLAINGHWGSARMQYRTDVGDHGNTVHSVVVDFTNAEFNDGGDEIFVPMVFTDGGKTVTLSAFSPLHGWYLGEDDRLTIQLRK